MKNPILECDRCRPSPLTDPTRLGLLEQSGLLDSPPEESFDRFSRLASQSLPVPVALVSLVDHRRQYFKSQVGLDEPYSQTRETPLSHSFCQYVVTSGAPLIIEDARCHDLVSDNLAISELGVIAYAGFPIEVDGWALGSFCAIDGHPRTWTEEELQLLSDLSGAVSTEVKLRLEIASHATTNERLREALAEAHEAHAARTRFFANISHELRTPLNSILGFSQILLEKTFGPLTAKQQRYLENIVTSADHLVELIGDLLDLSQLELRKFPLSLERVQLDLLVAEVVEGLTPMAEGRGLTLELEQACCEGVKGDRTRLRQVLYNLVHNAIKFTPAGGRVVIQTHPTSEGVQVAVKDTGLGLPEDRDFLFQPFERSVLTTEIGGTGLGLPIVKMLVEMHRGQLKVDSPGPGRGSSFSFVIPQEEEFS